MRGMTRSPERNAAVLVYHPMPWVAIKGGPLYRSPPSISTRPDSGEVGKGRYPPGVSVARQSANLTPWMLLPVDTWIGQTWKWETFPSSLRDIVSGAAG